jgi:membrane-bound lytic murein transglycosylase D
MDLPEALEKEIPFERVKIRKSMKLEDIAGRIETSEETLVYLNSELRHRITPDQDYDLRVPIEKAEVLLKKIDEIPRWELPSPDRDPRHYVRHRVKKGESLASIARRYRTTPAAIRSCNPALVKKGVRSGQALVIPVARKAAVSSVREAKKGTAGSASSYRVKKGDTLSALAERFDTTPERIRSLNRLKGNRLPAGRLLKIPSQGGEKAAAESPAQRKKAGSSKEKGDEAGKDGGKIYKVQKGDNLFRIAVRNGTSVDSLRKANNLRDGDSIHPGQVIQIR